MMSKAFVCLAFLLAIANTCLGATRCESARKKTIGSWIDPTTKISCPPFMGDDDDKFCCARADESLYCCDAKEYIEQNGVGFLIPMLVLVLVALFIICCVCCLCCPCCLWYKKRNRGTVYNNVPTVTMAQPAVPPHAPQSGMYPQQSYQYHPQSAGYPPIPPHGMPQQQYSYPPPVPPHANPPPYNEVTGTEMYPRQAPFNPSY